MRIILLALGCLLPSFHLLSQPANDHCEDAKDITNLIFNNDPGFSTFFFTLFQGATVDPLNYGSNDCWGYADHTTDHYPDVWLTLSPPLSPQP